jgi:hypothetical protein
MKVGITCRDESKVWNNGLHQNAYNLFKLYKKLKVDVNLVSQQADSIKVFDDKIENLNENSIKKYDVILEVSEALNDNLYNYFINSGKKVVSINYGNVLMTFYEDLVIDKKNSFCFSREGVENWISPHFYFAKGITKATSKKEAKLCPYIWSPEFLIKTSEKNNYNIFNKKYNPKKIGILEPNLSFIKNCIYPLLGCEILERKNNEKILEIMAFNTDNIRNSKRFLEIVKGFDIFKNKKISFEYRYNFPYLVSKEYFGLVISNNVNNDLNYLTLESLFLNMPIIHNSHFCKDGGYFYENSFDALAISNNIENIIDKHNDQSSEYNDKNKNVIWKFSPENPDNIKEYERLLNSIW